MPLYLHPEVPGFNLGRWQRRRLAPLLFKVADVAAQSLRFFINTWLRSIVGI